MLIGMESPTKRTRRCDAKSRRKYFANHQLLTTTLYLAD